MTGPSSISRRTALAGAATALVAALAACTGRRRGGGSVTTTDGASTTVASATTVVPVATVPVTTVPVTTVPVTTVPVTTVAPATDAYFPPIDGDWATISATDAGFTDAGLAEVLALVERSNSQSFVLTINGRIVAEQYWQGADAATRRDIASAQKSVTSTLMGLARDRGLLTFDQSVTSFLGAGWTAADVADEAQITLLQLMTMSSGLDPVTMTKKAAPGTVWEYNTDAYQRLRPVLEAASGRDINALSGEWLFDEIGLVDRNSWYRRPAMKDALGNVLWGLNLTAREMTRFGLFAMRGGQWAGRQITDPAWFAEAWTSIPLKVEYGYLWWLLGKGRLGRRGAPADLVAALGAQDQKIYVIPSMGLVLARQGGAADDTTAAESDFDTALIAAIGRARG